MLADIEADVQVRTVLSEIIKDIEELSWCIDAMLLWATNSSESMAITILIKVQKNNQKKLKNKLLQSLEDFYGSYSNKNTKNGSGKLWIVAKEFKKAQEHLQESFNQLIETIPKYSATVGEEESVRERLNSLINRGLQTVKIENKELMKDLEDTEQRRTNEDDRIKVYKFMFGGLRGVNTGDTGEFEGKELMLDQEDSEQQRMNENDRINVYKFMFRGLQGVNTGDTGEFEGKKKIRKAKPWKHSVPITRAQLTQMREEFWDTAPNYGGRREIWDALKAAAEAELSFAQKIIDRAGVIVLSDDLTVCYDERGAKYELPKYVLSAPVNLIRDN